jgi:hypothetical protein
MNEPATPIDFSTAAPELQRLAEEVRVSRQARAIQRDGETIAVIAPVAAKHARKRAATRPRGDVSTMERVEAELTLPPPPSSEEIAARQVLAQQILANRKRRVIAPLTSADLVRQVRQEEFRSYDDRH